MIAIGCGKGARRPSLVAMSGDGQSRDSAGAAELEPIFLVCAPRSGSAFLRNVLGTHPAIACGPETYAFEAIGQLLAAVDRRSARGQGLVGRGYLDEAGLRRAAAEFFRTAVATRTGTRRYFVEKTPMNTDLLAVIDRIFPDAKLVHLIRDGRDVACSMMAAERERRMQLPTTVVQCAERWRKIGKVIDFGRRHPERYCEVRYEAALADLAGELRRIFAFLGIALSDGELRAMQAEAEKVVHPSAASAADGYVGKWRAAFSSDDVRAFKDTAGELLRELGYVPDDRW